MFRLCVLVMLVGVSAAQVFKLGRCPLVRLKRNFDINQYIGVWFVDENFRFLSQRGQKCLKTEYTFDNNKVFVRNSGIEISSGDPISTDGSVSQSRLNAAKLDVRFSSFLPPRRYWVWDTDYTNYALVFSCYNYMFFHSEVIWIMSRSQSGISSSTRTALYSLIRSKGFNPGNFESNDQSNCTTIT